MDERILKWLMMLEERKIDGGQVMFIESEGWWFKNVRVIDGWWKKNNSWWGLILVNSQWDVFCNVHDGWKKKLMDKWCWSGSASWMERILDGWWNDWWMIADDMSKWWGRDSENLHEGEWVNWRIFDDDPYWIVFTDGWWKKDNSWWGFDDEMNNWINWWKISWWAWNQEGKWWLILLIWVDDSGITTET